MSIQPSYFQLSPVLIILIMLYIISLLLTYLLTGSLYLLTAFIQCPPPLLATRPPALVTTNPIFFSMRFLFVKDNWPTHYISSWYKTYCFDISIHFKMITRISLVAICHYPKILQLLTVFPSLYIHTHESFILQLEICTA